MILFKCPDLVFGHNPDTSNQFRAETCLRCRHILDSFLNSFIKFVHAMAISATVLKLLSVESYPIMLRSVSTTLVPGCQMLRIILSILVIAFWTVETWDSSNMSIESQQSWLGLSLCSGHDLNTPDHLRAEAYLRFSHIFENYF